MGRRLQEGRRIRRRILSLFALLMVILPASAVAARPAMEEQQVTFGRFGSVTLYHELPRSDKVAIFLSGDGGWNKGVVDMARILARQGVLVVGVDIRHFEHRLNAAKERCNYPAADLEALSQFVQRYLKLPFYRRPALIGYSSGATMAYAALVEAPPGTFQGGIGLGFCPDLDLRRPLCRGSGLTWRVRPKRGKLKAIKRHEGVTYVFNASATLEEPWIVLQGTIDKVCNPQRTIDYMRRVANGKTVVLPRVGHGYSVQRHWVPQFRAAVKELFGASPPPGVRLTESVAGLPLVEVGGPGAGDTLAVLLSGDGGWASLDRQVGIALAARGLPVIGLDSLRYFWTKRTPDGAALDLARLLRHYLDLWHKRRVVVIGYSFGADVLPFMIHRLPDDLQRRLLLAALISPSPKVSFEFHVTDWLPGSGGRYEVAPEVEKLGALHTLCFYGAEEDDSICPRLPKGSVSVVRAEGGHHLGGNYAEIAERILRAAGLEPRALATKTEEREGTIAP